MSEYQYYEFQAIDRPLTEKEQAEVGALSSRTDPTPYQASFVYHYTGFPGDSLEILTQYYDAMLYMANWGTSELAFRFPKSIVSVEQLQPYEYTDSIEIWTEGGVRTTCH